jgi:hypothetical protein
MIINLIGPRASGKLTYLAMLSCWNKQQLTKPRISVDCVNSDAIELMEKAENIIFQGNQVEPTMVQDPDRYPVYQFDILIKNNIFKKVNLNVSARNIPGEIFESTNYFSSTSTIETIGREAGSYLLIIDASSYRGDVDYAKYLENYLSKLIQVNKSSALDQKIRIAFTLSKCDLPDIWLNRDNADKLVSRRFPQTKQILDKWVANGAVEARYFVSSSFGCYGVNNREPNLLFVRRDKFGTFAVLKEPASWRPYGLISPIYWLCTGESLKGLDCY